MCRRKRRQTGDGMSLCFLYDVLKRIAFRIIPSGEREPGTGAVLKRLRSEVRIRDEPCVREPLPWLLLGKPFLDIRKTRRNIKRHFDIGPYLRRIMELCFDKDALVIFFRSDIDFMRDAESPDDLADLGMITASIQNFRHEAFERKTGRTQLGDRPSQAVLRRAWPVITLQERKGVRINFVRAKAVAQVFFDVSDDFLDDIVTRLRCSQRALKFLCIPKLAFP